MSTNTPTARHARGTRLAPEERREMILTGAVGFFARKGFEAQMRELSDELNVSQALIYRYFDSKRELLEEVYTRTFISRWSDDWTAILRDRSVDLGDRLRRFYLDYLRIVDDHDWIRIAMFSGLSGNALIKRYIETQVEALLRVIAVEVTLVGGGDTSRTEQLPDEIYEQVWHLHSSFIYYAVRKHVMQTRVAAEHATVVNAAVASFLRGLDPRYAAPGREAR